MTLEEFRRLVRSEFGADLHRMTPANVREFLDRLQEELAPARDNHGRFSINEPERTYEGIVRDFLGSALEMPPEQGVILLWLYCLEMATSSVSELEETRFKSLFASLAAGDDLP